MQKISNRVVNSLHNAGAKLLVGADIGNPYVIPRFSVHEELTYLVEADLSPYEVLKPGTFNTAQALGRLNDFGTVSMGKRADLILVNGSPPENAEIDCSLRRMRIRCGVTLITPIEDKWIKEWMVE